MLVTTSRLITIYAVVIHQDYATVFILEKMFL